MSPKYRFSLSLVLFAFLEYSVLKAWMLLHSDLHVLKFCYKKGAFENFDQLKKKLGHYDVWDFPYWILRTKENREAARAIVHTPSAFLLCLHVVVFSGFRI